MTKYTQAAIMRLDEIVQCKDCGKRMRRGERIVGFSDIVCRECAKKRRERRW